MENTPRFADFGFHADILKAIEKTGYEKPTDIQAKAIPIVLQGHDMMGAAQTGTGKTAAFTLPILQRLMPLASHSMSPAKHPVRVLILTPTRELADQVAENVANYSEFTPLRSCVVFGGVDYKEQKAQLQQGCEILIATPGRLRDHIEQKSVNLSQVGMLVLDEADRMLNMGFLPDLTNILKHLPNQRQSLLFSATFSPEIRALAKQFLRTPIEINVAPKNSTAERITQTIYAVSDRQKMAAVHYLLTRVVHEQCIVFTNRKRTVGELTRYLKRMGVKADAIHGDRTQSERLRVLEAFKEKEVTVLVATDVAARGLDIAGLPYVINVDLPFNAEDYVHRIGRTGRAGQEGHAISLCGESDEKNLEDIARLTRQSLKAEPLQIPRDFLNPRAAERQQQDSFFYRPYDEAATGEVSAPAQRSAPVHSSEKRAKEPSEGRKKLPPAFASTRKDKTQLVAVLLGGKGR